VIYKNYFYNTPFKKIMQKIRRKNKCVIKIVMRRKVLWTCE